MTDGCWSGGIVVKTKTIVLHLYFFLFDCLCFFSDPLRGILYLKFFLRSFFGHFLTSGGSILANIMFRSIKIDLERDMISIKKHLKFFLLHTCGSTYDLQSQIVDFLLNLDVPENFRYVPDVCK